MLFVRFGKGQSAGALTAHGESVFERSLLQPYGTLYARTRTRLRVWGAVISTYGRLVQHRTDRQTPRERTGYRTRLSPGSHTSREPTIRTVSLSAERRVSSD